MSLKDFRFYLFFSIYALLTLIQNAVSVPQDAYNYIFTTILIVFAALKLKDFIGVCIVVDIIHCIYSL